MPGLLAGALVRAAALPLPGTVDTDLWKVWAFGATYDLTGAYGVGGSPPERRVLRWQGSEAAVDYPPVALVELAAVGRLYRVAHPLFDDSPLFAACVKLPGLAAEAVAVGLLLTLGRRRFGPDAAAWTALALWLNPAVVLDGSVLGYLDAEMAIPVAIALVLAVSEAPWLAGALAAVAVLTKAQAIFVVPVIVAALVRWRPTPQLGRLARALGGAGLVSAVVLLPFVARGAWANLVQGLSRLAKQDMISAYAPNVWWIVTWIVRVLDVAGQWGWKQSLTQRVRILAASRAVALGYPNPRVVGLLIVGGALAWALWRARRALPLATTAALAGWCAYAYSVFAAQVHENHLYLAVPCFTLAAGLERRYAPVLLAVSVVLAINLLLFYGLGRNMPPVFDRRWTGVDASVLLAFANVAIFVWTTMRIVRMPPTETRAAA